MTEEHEHDEPIKVTDRRAFDREGNLRSDAPAEDTTSGRGPGFVHAPGSEPEPDPAPVPGTDFTSFVESFAYTAFIHLGMAEEPQSGQRQVNLEGARQVIELLGMLEEKTRGNLDDNETAMLRRLLSELRMAFVSLSSSQGQGPKA